MPELTDVQSAARPSRSRQIVECLRGGVLYSEKRARDLLFQAIEEYFYSGAPPVMLARLARQSATAARSAAQELEYSFSNWDPAARAVVNAMLFAGALLSADGTPIPPGLRAQASLVSGLRTGHRDRTEAYLLEFVIERLGDLSIRDHKALAHALFRQFDEAISMEDMEDRVVLLLATLDGRVRLRGDGMYVVERERT
ncbi:MAG: hypothetical protein ACKV2U_16660 [Bryobacteraceae bacterium]